MPTISQEQFVNEVVPTLPQGKHIKEQDAREWHASVMRYDPERLGWHIARLKGLGGSDVGEIAAWKLGVFNVFKTPRDIIDEKLLRRPIEPPNNNMRRGTYLEPIIQRIFLEDYQAQSRTDLIEIINKQQDPKHPWLRGNVDDVVEIGGLVFVVDYKAPTEAHDEAPLQYAAQVHQYGHLLELGAGERPYSHLIAPFDYANGSVAAIEVPFDQQIMDAVLEGGDEIWNHVLSGTYPEFVQTKAEDLSYQDDELERIGQLEEEFIRYKLLADAATDKHKALAKELEQAINKQGEFFIKGQKLPLEVLSGSARQKLDEEKTQAILMQAGVKPDEFQVVGKKLDEDKVISALSETFGQENVESFYAREFDLDKVLEFCKDKGIAPPVVETLSVSLRASKKGLDKAAVNAAKQSAAKIVEQGSSQVDLGDDDELDQSQTPSAA